VGPPCFTDIEMRIKKIIKIVIKYPVF
jgi:hypothetical protein